MPPAGAARKVIACEILRLRRHRWEEPHSAHTRRRV